MNKKILNHFNQTLTLHRNTLLNWLNTDPAKKNVCLGSAGEKEVWQVISDLKNVLENINSGEFGGRRIRPGAIDKICIGSHQ